MFVKSYWWSLPQHLIFPSPFLLLYFFPLVPFVEPTCIKWKVKKQQRLCVIHFSPVKKFHIGCVEWSLTAWNCWGVQTYYFFVCMNCLMKYSRKHFHRWIYPSRQVYQYIVVLMSRNAGKNCLTSTSHLTELFVFFHIIWYKTEFCMFWWTFIGEDTLWCRSWSSVTPSGCISGHAPTMHRSFRFSCLSTKRNLHFKINFLISCSTD